MIKLSDVFNNNAPLLKASRDFSIIGSMYSLDSVVLVKDKYIDTSNNEEIKMDAVLAFRCLERLTKQGYRVLISKYTTIIYDSIGKELFSLRSDKDLDEKIFDAYYNIEIIRANRLV